MRYRPAYSTFFKIAGSAIELILISGADDNLFAIRGEFTRHRKPGHAIPGNKNNRTIQVGRLPQLGRPHHYLDTAIVLLVESGVRIGRILQFQPMRDDEGRIDLALLNAVKQRP